MQFSAEDGACHDTCHVAWPSGWTPFSKYVIQMDKSGMTCAIVSSCLQLLEAPSSVVLNHCEILCLALRLHLACGMNYLQCQYNFPDANCS